MNPIRSFPNRPLQPEDIATLDNDSRLTVAPYGGIPAQNEIYAVKIAAGGRAYAFAFDSHGGWQQLAAFDAEDLAAADRQLDVVLDEWIRERYGGRFEVLKAL